MQEHLLSWLLEGGSVSLPKRVFALMDSLGLDFSDIGRLLYLLSLEGSLPQGDHHAREAAMALAARGLVLPSGDGRRVDFGPFVSRILEVTGQKEKPQEKEASPSQAYVDLVKRFERDQGRFLSLKEKGDLSKVMQQYGWSADLTYEIYHFYLKNHRRRNYGFGFFAQMAFQAKVTDKESFADFCKHLDHNNRKTAEVLRRLGKYNNPSEVQKEMYAKWQHTWGFSHEMILMATEDTASADNPSFGYLDQILAQWHDQGISSPEEVAKMRQDRTQAKRVTRRRGASAKPLRNRHLDQEGSRDFSHLEE